MATNGVVPNLDSKYTFAERQTFFEIVKANSEGNHTLMGTLVEKLDSGQRARCKEYIIDLGILKAHEEAQEQQLKAKMAYHQARIDQGMNRVSELDDEIAELERKEKLVFSEGAKQTAKQQMTFSKGTAHEVVAKRKAKPGKSGSQDCVIM